MLKMSFFAVGAIDRDDAFLAVLIEQRDGGVEGSGGFFLFAFGNQSLDLFDGGAELGLSGFVGKVSGLIGLIAFDLGFDVWHVGSLPFVSRGLS